jgi:hypothetical protein
VLWANARADALGFYEWLGMTPIGPTFTRANTGSVHRVVALELPGTVVDTGAGGD